MKVIRAHDYAFHSEPKPDFKALRLILVAFIVTAAFCLAMCVGLIVRGKVPQAGKHVPCDCGCGSPNGRKP
jgi:hypothetical protein